MKLTLSEQLTQFSQLLQRELFPLLEAAEGRSANRANCW